MLDGANLVDPGNQGTQIANINQDMTSEVKVLMSGYDAAYAKGPVVFQAYGKSGGSRFHGEGYLYARNNIFNSNESFNQSEGIKKVDAYEYILVSTSVDRSSCRSPNSIAVATSCFSGLAMNT